MNQSLFSKIYQSQNVTLFAKFVLSFLLFSLPSSKKRERLKREDRGKGDTLWSIITAILISDLEHKDMDSTAPINLFNKTLNKLKHNIHKRNKYNPAFRFIFFFFIFFYSSCVQFYFFYVKAFTNLLYRQIESSIIYVIIYFSSRLSNLN